MGEKRGMQALEAWCRKVTTGYPGVNVTNMTSSWRNGMAFCALIHYFRPDLIDFESLSPENVYKNNELAFTIAEQHLGIPALLDPEDMVQYTVPDKLSIMTYLSQFYQVLGNQKAKDGSPRSPIKRPPTSENTPCDPSGTPVKVFVRQFQGVSSTRRQDPCVVCKNPVFLAERLIINAKLHHRTCFRCARCSSLLSVANYYETEQGQYCCETCPDEVKQNLVQDEVTEAIPSQDSDQLLSKIAAEGNDGAASDQQPIKGQPSEPSSRAADQPVRQDVTERPPSVTSRIEFFQKNFLPPEPQSSVRQSIRDGQRHLLKTMIDDVDTITTGAQEVEIIRNETVVEASSSQTVTVIPSDKEYESLVNSVQETGTNFKSNVDDSRPVEGLQKGEHQSDTQETTVATDVSRADVASPVPEKLPAEPPDLKDSEVEDKHDVEETVTEVSVPLLEETAENRPENGITNTALSIQVPLDSPDPELLARTTDSTTADSNMESVVEPSVEHSMPTEYNVVPKPRRRNRKSGEASTHTEAIAVSAKEHYPETLNPFEDELEESSSMVEPKSSTPNSDVRTSVPEMATSSSKNVTTPSSNPFGSDDEEEEQANTAPTSTTPKKILPAPKLSLNPFLSDEEEEDEEEESKDNDLKGHWTRVDHSTKQPKPDRPPPPSTFNIDHRGSSRSLQVASGFRTKSPTFSLASSSSSPSPTKKKHAPPPPLPPSASVHKGEGKREQPSGSAPTTLRRKERPAPPPPGEITLQSPNESLLKGDSSLEVAQSSTASTSVPVPAPRTTLPASPVPTPRTRLSVEETSPDSESDVVLREKSEKDMSNLNRQRGVNKDSHGQWKRKKGPAPPRPLPQKRHLKKLPLKVIQQELHDIEIKQLELERQGVSLEQSIRNVTESDEAARHGGSCSVEVEEMILQLFDLVNEKNELLRRQTELMYIRRQQRLEEEHAELEFQIRCLMEKPESEKSEDDKAREEELIQRLVEVVHRRSEIVDCLEMDRRREVEEDKSIQYHLDMFNSRGQSSENAQCSPKEKSKTLKMIKSPIKLMKKDKKKKSKKKVDADKDVDECESDTSAIQSSSAVNETDKDKKKSKHWFAK